MSSKTELSRVLQSDNIINLELMVASDLLLYSGHTNKIDVILLVRTFRNNFTFMIFLFMYLHKKYVTIVYMIKTPYDRMAYAQGIFGKHRDRRAKNHTQKP